MGKTKQMDPLPPLRTASKSQTKTKAFVGCCRVQDVSFCHSLDSTRLHTLGREHGLMSVSSGLFILKGGKGGKRLGGGAARACAETESGLSNNNQRKEARRKHEGWDAIEFWDG